MSGASCSFVGLLLRRSIVRAYLLNQGRLSMNRVALRRALLMALVFCAGAAAPTLVEQIAFAQVKPPEFVKPGPNAPATVGKFLSGEDVGFRFSNLDRDGAAVGTLMVK